MNRQWAKKVFNNFLTSKGTNEKVEMKKTKNSKVHKIY